MGRRVRVQFAGALYHVMCRGDRREDIFYDDADRLLFLKTLWQTCDRTGFVIFSYVLIFGNEYSLMASNRQLQTIVKDFSDKIYKAKDSTDRLDLLLVRGVSPRLLTGVERKKV